VSRGPDPARSRRNKLEITAAGRTLLAQLESAFRAMQDELLGSLSPEDRAEIQRLLTLVAVPAPAASVDG
jgi:DNA-binding MarR family transcriptional regulator